MMRVVTVPGGKGPAESLEGARAMPSWRCSRGGGYAEYAVVDERHALPVPAGPDFVQAAALPETVFTVWTNVFERGGLEAGETLLVHGANSGFGPGAFPSNSIPRRSLAIVSTRRRFQNASTPS